MTHAFSNTIVDLPGGVTFEHDDNGWEMRSNWDEKAAILINTGNGMSISLHHLFPADRLVSSTDCSHRCQ